MYSSVVVNTRSPVFGVVIHSEVFLADINVFTEEAGQRGRAPQGNRWNITADLATLKTQKDESEISW